MSRSLTLLLSHDLASVQQRLPALEALLARGERRCDQPTDGPRRLLQLCAVAAAPQRELPLGPLCALGDGLAAGEGYWLCAEPVHLVADQDKVYLAARAATLSVTAEEAAALSTEFNALFRDDGWQLFAPVPTRWYLRLPQALQITTHAPDHAMGWDMRPKLPHGADALRLLAALNEIQMLFHASSVNARRNAAGRPAINSLWLWGGAAMPAVVTPWQQVQGDDCLLRGLAARAGIPCGTADAAATWLAGTGDGLVWFDAAGDELARLEQNWFVPLLAALRSGGLAQLDIHLTQTPCSIHLEPRAARRWWRRSRPLAVFAANA